MFTDSTHTELLIEEEKRTSGRKLVAAACAILITALVIAGYAYLRKRHSQMLATTEQAQQPLQSLAKGPAKAHILVDDPLLKAGQTIIGGTVKNISAERLATLSVGLELRRRKDAVLEQMQASVDPPNLEPGQEGRYVIKAPAHQYSSVRLVGLRSGSDASLLVYTSSQGQKRPPERLEPRTVTVPRTGGRAEFLNSPDHPARVP